MEQASAQAMVVATALAELATEEVIAAATAVATAVVRTVAAMVEAFAPVLELEALATEEVSVRDTEEELVPVLELALELAKVSSEDPLALLAVLAVVESASVPESVKESAECLLEVLSEALLVSALVSVRVSSEDPSEDPSEDLSEELSVSAPESVVVLGPALVLFQ